MGCDCDECDEGYRRKPDSGNAAERPAEDSGLAGDNTSGFEKGTYLEGY